MSETIKVVIVDDHDVIRVGVKQSLGEGIDVVGAVSYTHLTLPTN